MNPTPAMLSALKWLKNRTGDGVFDRRGVLVAAGVRAPIRRSTWNELDGLGLVALHCSRKRLRLTDLGWAYDLSGVRESETRG